MDVSARGLLIAEQMIADGRHASFLRDRYAAWEGEFGRAVMAGKVSLEDAAARVAARNTDLAPVSGRQEFLENLLNEYC
jgi:xylose isomerase